MNVDAQVPVDAVDAPQSSEDAAGPVALRPSRRTWWRTGAVLAGLVAYATTAQLSTQEIVVQPGDTLTKIASDYHVSVAAITAFNDLANPNLIVAGRTLVIPAATGETTHQVRMGDTVSRIAAIYGSTSAAIVARNNLTNPDMIRIGQMLVIPRATAAPAPAAPATTAPATTAAPTTSVAPVTAPPTTSTAPPAAVVGSVPTTAPATTAPATTAAPSTTAAAAPTSTGPAPTFPRVSSGGLVSTMWVVQPGDTVASIASRFGLAPRRLAAANAIAETDPLLPGQRIYIPQG